MIRIFNKAAAPSSRYSQRGATLIEVLISLLLITIGLLGIAASQITSLKMTLSSYQRSQATVFANDIADRLRANIKEAEKAGTKYISAMPNGVNHGTDCVSYTGPLTNSCSTEKMAEQDVFDWAQRLKNEFNGEGIVCRDNSPNDGTGAASALCDGLAASPLVIKIWWDDDRDTATDKLLFATSLQL